MANKYDYPRLSTFISGIVDRRVRGVALSITNSVGYLKSLVVQSSTYASAAQTSASNAETYEAGASAAEASALITYTNFTSTYVGVRDSDAHAQVSSLNNPLNTNSFYIRSTDRHIRQVAAIDPNSGTVTWQDAFVSVDPASVYTAGDTRYLSLNETDHTQTVQSAVTFQGTLSVKSVTDWTTSQPPQASDVATLMNGAYTDLSAYARSTATVVQNNLDNFAQQFVVGANSNGFYEKRYGGIIEQWGRVRIPATQTSIMSTTINFPVEFADANSISINTTSYRITGSSWTENISILYGDPNQSNCLLVVGTSNQNQVFTNDLIVGWRAIGFSSSVPQGAPSNPANNGNSGSSSGSTPTTPTNTGTGATSDPGNTGSGGGTTVYPSGPSQCPEVITPILLANPDQTGPGDYVIAGNLKIGDVVWTQHETSLVWGAYPVVRADVFDGMLWQADGYHKATQRHRLYLDNRWVEMGSIGHQDGPGKAVAITVQDAHTYITLDVKGNQVLNHNIKREADNYD
jgi:hypothetical protein